MFIEVNGTMYNMYSISSFKGDQRLVESSAGTNSSVIIYLILYETNDGIVHEETFDNKEDRDKKLDLLSSKFVVTD